MINNNLCLTCDKAAVCKIFDILVKFDGEAKKPLGVDLTINSCLNFEDDSAENEGNE